MGADGVGALAQWMEPLGTALVVAVGAVAVVLSLLNVLVAPERGAAKAAHERWPATGRLAPTDVEIAKNAERLASLGLLPAGWSRRDAERLLRIHAYRVRRESGQAGGYPAVA